MIKLKSMLYEGNWGYGPLDGDGPSDWKWKIGKLITTEIKSKLNSNDFSDIYSAIGMWEYFRKTLDTQYSFFTSDVIKSMDNLCSEKAQKILDNQGELIDLYKSDGRDGIIKYLNKIVDKKYGEIN